MRVLYGKILRSIFSVAEILASPLPWLCNQAKNFIAGLLPALLCAAFGVFLLETLVPVGGVRFGLSEIWRASPARTFISTIEQCGLEAVFLVRSEVPLALAIVLVAFVVGEQIRRIIAAETRPEVLAAFARVVSRAFVRIVIAWVLCISIDAVLAANFPLTDADRSCIVHAAFGQGGARW